MAAPRPKNLNRKSLMAAMDEERKKAREAVKMIHYPMPDLRGPAGNAFALLGEAQALMKKAGVKDAFWDEFHTEATSGDYENLLRTIRKWFTLVVPVTDYVTLDDASFESFIGANAPTDDEDETLEASELAAQEKYQDFEDPQAPEVLDLRGLTPAEVQQRMAEHAAQKAGGTDGDA